MILSLEIPEVWEAVESGELPKSAGSAIEDLFAGYELLVAFEIELWGSFTPATLESPAEHVCGHINSVSVDGEELTGEVREAMIQLFGGESDLIELKIEGEQENYRWERAEAQLREMEMNKWND